ncbi:MAG: sugar ABC transporter ATP-binding protein [Leucobacter sp.]
MIEIDGISKHYPGVTALSEVSLTIRKGEVLALAGENGSGKSTMMKILAGHIQPDEGRILIDGEPVQFHSPTDAVAAGIGLVEQELAVATHLTVGENILLGALPRRRMAAGLIDWPEVRRRAREVMDLLQIEVNPRAVLGDLPVNVQQLVAIACVLARGPRVMLLDEATSSLSESETDHVLSTVRSLRDEGMSIVFISHRMREMRQVADRIVVLRDGVVSGSAMIDEVSDDEVVRMLVGRELKEIFPANSRRSDGREVLAVEGLQAGRGLKNASLTVNSGEIVGIAGLVGSGRSTLAQCIGGALRPASGRILLHGKEMRFRHPADALAAGIGYVGENRKAQGVLPGRSITENLTVIDSSSRSRSRRFLSRKNEEKRARGAAASVGAKYGRLSEPIESLSGGNQQKILLARALMRRPEVLVLDEPTRGVDIGAKSEIYTLIDQAASQGMGVLVVSSELPELLGLCDRIVILSHGHVVGELDRASASEERIAALAFSSSEQVEAE